MEAKKLYPALFKMCIRSKTEQIFSGILHKNGLVVSTNKIVLAEVRFDYLPEYEGKVLNIEGIDLSVEHGSFVKYESVIPDKYTMEKYDGEISLKELTLACKNIIRAKKTDPLPILQIGLKYYNPEELIMLLNVFEVVAELPAIYQRESAGCTLFQSDNVRGLCFEYRIEGEDNDARKIYNIRNNTKKAFYE